MKKKLLIFGSLLSIVIMLNIPVISAIEFNSAKQEIVENFNNILEVNNKELLFGCIFKFFSKLVGVAGYVTSGVLSFVIITIGTLLMRSLITPGKITIGAIVALIIGFIAAYTSSKVHAKGYEFALKRLDKFGDKLITISYLIFASIQSIWIRYLGNATKK